jgi:hypothetical protein
MILPEDSDDTRGGERSLLLPEVVVEVVVVETSLIKGGEDQVYSTYWVANEETHSTTQNIIRPRLII